MCRIGLLASVKMAVQFELAFVSIMLAQLTTL
jgi:hypothetical protein